MLTIKTSNKICFIGKIGELSKEIQKLTLEYATINDVLKSNK